MRTICRCIAVVLMVSCLLPMQSSIAELSPERAAFYQERTEEWEASLGSYALWNYYERAMFCAIYGRRPGDYLNDEGIQEDVPKFPPEDCLLYEEAVSIAKESLCNYDHRITEEYLSRLHISSAYYDFWADPTTTVTRTSHVQVWIIQFREENDAGEYMMRCGAYIDANTGRVVSIDIGIDMSNSYDWENYKIIDFH